MALSIVTSPTLALNVGSIFLYTVSAVETGALGGVSAIHHFEMSASVGPADTSRVTLVSATDGSAVVQWVPRVSDVVTSAGGSESLAMVLTVFDISGTAVQQALSISADLSPSYKKRSNIGDGTSEGNSDIADFFMKGLGTKG